MAWPISDISSCAQIDLIIDLASNNENYCKILIVLFCTSCNISNSPSLSSILCGICSSHFMHIFCNIFVLTPFHTVWNGYLFFACCCFVCIKIRLVKRYQTLLLLLLGTTVNSQPIVARTKIKKIITER